MAFNGDFSLPAPLPQVGAVLACDTDLVDPLVHPRMYLGSKHWKLTGSCVLVARDRILTLNHVYQRSSPVAVFFPYEGLFAVSPEITQQGYAHGDNLIVCILYPRRDKKGNDRFPHAPPLPFAKVYKAFKAEGHALVCGFGRWSESVFEGLNGLQQRYRIRLGQGKAPSPNTTERDLLWSSEENGGMAAGRHNSGGPLLYEGEEGYSIIGLNREENGDHQIASWIDWKRKRDLDELLAQSQVRGGETGKRWHQAFSLDAGSQGKRFKISAPPGTRRVQATLSATDGLRLQMKIGRKAREEDFLEQVAKENDADGRFLFRELVLDDNLEEAETFIVGVVPSPKAPPKADRVVAQLSVLCEEEQPEAGEVDPSVNGPQGIPVRVKRLESILIKSAR